MKKNNEYLNAIKRIREFFNSISKKSFVKHPTQDIEKSIQIIENFFEY